MTVTAEGAIVDSRLWTFAMMTGNSSIFPKLVEGAALLAKKPYTRDLLAHVAASPAVLAAVKVPIRGGVDGVLESLITSNGAAVDKVITDAVSAYQPPAQQPGGGGGVGLA